MNDNFINFRRPTMPARRRKMEKEQEQDRSGHRSHRSRGYFKHHKVRQAEESLNQWRHNKPKSSRFPGQNSHLIAAVTPQSRMNPSRFLQSGRLAGIDSTQYPRQSTPPQQELPSQDRPPQNQTPQELKSDGSSLSYLTHAQGDTTPRRKLQTKPDTPESSNAIDLHTDNYQQSIFITHEAVGPEPGDDHFISNVALRKQLDDDFLAMEGWLIEPWVTEPLFTEIKQAGKRRLEDTVEVRLACKAYNQNTNLNLQDPLLGAIKKGYTRMAQFCLAHGASTHTIEEDINQTLSEVVSNAHIDMAERADWLLKNGAPQEAMINRLEPALDKSLRCGYLANAGWLINIGTPLNIQHQFGQALGTLNTRVADWLIKNYQANPDPEKATQELVRYVSGGFDGESLDEKVYGCQPAEWLVASGGAYIDALKPYAADALARLLSQGDYFMAKWLLKHKLTTLQSLTVTQDELLSNKSLHGSERKGIMDLLTEYGPPGEQAQ